MVTFELVKLLTPELPFLINSAMSKIYYHTKADGLPILNRTDLLSTDLKSLVDNEAIYYILENGDKVGCVSLTIDKKIMYVGLLSVLPKFENRGIGTKTMDFAEDLAKVKLCEVMELDYFYSDFLEMSLKIKNWYQKLGYNEIGKNSVFESDLIHGQVQQLKKKPEFDECATSEIIKRVYRYNYDVVLLQKSLLN